METKYIEPNWKDAERVARFFDWDEDKVPGAKKRLNILRNTALFKEIQTDINAEAGVRQQDRLAQDEQKRASMRQMLQAQALEDGPLPEDEQTRLLEQLPTEDKKAYRVAQRRDAMRDMNPAYANVSNEDLSGLTKRIDSDVGMSKIILPQREEVGSEEWDIPRELLERTSDAVEPKPGARYECLQAIFQDDSLVDSRLQLRSRGAVEDPRSPESTNAGAQNGRTSRRRLWTRRTEAHGAYELPEPVGDNLLRLPPSTKNKDGLPNLCRPERQQRLARWEALKETSAKISTLDEDMTLSNVRTNPDVFSDGSVIWLPRSLTPVHFDEEPSDSDFKVSRRSTRATHPSIKLRTDLQKPHGRALPKQSSDGGHPGFRCTLCGNPPYADKNGLRRHTKKRHPEQASDSQPSLSRSVSPTKEGRVRCTFCGVHFASNSTMYRHQRDQHPDRSAEFEHGKPRPSTVPVDTDLSRLRERSTTRSKRRDSATYYSLGGFKPLVITAARTGPGARRSSNPFDTDLSPNCERSTKLSDDDVSADSAVDDKPEEAAATTSSSATKPETSLPSPRKRPAADSGDEKEQSKAVVNTRNNSEL
ncbi:hypothetical protein HII31_06763 [Pseudocercospora fuligena]|uniref:C2H2-type domain-containing protein n=1 Tax=Pseudocercospora fuligena TaxID=685502 RepID=A0A8H6RII2_9PEZI|nr:hypothetical protein HII31_06763 [Pseudocercospora fuligena]